ncbi:MAG TPA: hypothetical protein PLD23_08915 [Armatimonadota bacterium]|nr:hypothetical protein [Armatimonadota bacterium]HQK93614.1 hypothetical protein [Armatimonadota bacterium]
MPDEEWTPQRIAELMSAAPPPRVAAILADLADLVASYVATGDGSEADRICAAYRALEAQLPPEWRPGRPAVGLPKEPPCPPQRRRERPRLV